MALRIRERHWRRGGGQRPPHVARRDPARAVVGHTDLEPAAVSGRVNHGGHRAVRDPLKALGAARGVVEVANANMLRALRNDPMAEIPPDPTRGGPGTRR